MEPGAPRRIVPSRLALVRAVAKTAAILLKRVADNARDVAIGLGELGREIHDETATTLAPRSSLPSDRTKNLRSMNSRGAALSS